MIYVNIQFVERLAFGLQRKVAWSTAVSRNQGGYDNTTQNWSKPMRLFDAGFAVRVASDFEAIEAHFHSVRGRSYKFPLKDVLDFQVTAAVGILVLDEEASDPQYNLAKAYGSGPYPYVRFITRPNVTTVSVFLLRGATTTNVTDDVSIDDETGIVTFDTDILEPGDVLSWSGEFWVPCRYDTDELPAVVVNKEPGEDGELYVQCDGIPICEVKE